jgi:hypothetical protein
MTTQEVAAWTTAKMLIAKGLRPPVVHAATGLCRNRLRNMYFAIHGRSALQGRVSEHAHNRIKTRSQVIEGITFYQVYYRLGGEMIFRMLDLNLFLEAYEKYECYSPNCLDAMTAFCIARDLLERQPDLQGNVLVPRRCPECGREYLYDARSDLMSRCPLCHG